MNNITNKEYLKVGENKIVEGEIYIRPDYYDNGLDQGIIFKDAEAYEKYWDAICYVPEYGVSDCEPDENGFYHEFDGYTHNDLLDKCNGNRELCDYLFSNLSWTYPDTYMNEIDDENISYFYRFIKPGAKVWWNDPVGETSGEYSVYVCPFEFDENDEIKNPEAFGPDAIILIGNEYSEAEVPPFELTPIYKS